MDDTLHADEPHEGPIASRLNWLRAGVLGANDGIVSTAGLVVGVAGATSDAGTLLVAGIAGLVAGSLSMAGGEYVSVSTQRDSEQALLEKERAELASKPDEELAELAGIYRDKGLTAALALQVAQQLHDHDALAAHAEAELGIDPDALTSPMNAAVSSMLAFAVGSVLPLLAIVLPPVGWRVPVTVATSVVALAATGAISARLGESPRRPAVVRNVGIGLMAMSLTWVVGLIVGAGIG